MHKTKNQSNISTDQIAEPNITGRDIIKGYVKDMPESPGVYRMIDQEGKVLYIGKAKNLKKRVTSYTKLDLQTRLQRMVFLTKSMLMILTKTEAEALLLEASLIKKLQPRFNILLRDDKSYPYIKIRTDHDFPQLIKYRGKKTNDGKLFGPFASIRDVDRTIYELQKIFKLRPCSDNYFKERKRPCLQYQIGRCSGPCVGKVTKDDYDKTTKQIESFLSGKTHQLQDELNIEMQKCSENEQYEKAASIRDRIKALSYVQMKGTPAEFQIGDADVIAVFMDQGEVCVQVFLYRGGQSYGNKPFFPIHAEGSLDSEVLASFLGQYYQSHPAPAEIIINHKIEDAEVLETALAELHGHKTKIIVPMKGAKAKLIELALNNAKNSLKYKLNKIYNNENLLAEVQKIFNLPSMPERIEVYDNSHIFGKYAVGAMIVAGREGFDKGAYRRFTIDSSRISQMPDQFKRPIMKSSAKIDEDPIELGIPIIKTTNHKITGGDDYAMLREVLTRRIKRIKDGSNPMPDLMIIDGGKGHMTTVQKLLSDLKIEINFVCMSKGPERHAGKEFFHMPGREAFTIDKNEPVMKYLQILRDEVHNFAIKSHRIKRSNAIKVSLLDNIPGIGPKRKKALLELFGSVEAIKGASVEELIKTGHINKKVATAIYEYMHS